MGIHRVFESLLAEFVSGPVIFFAMGFSGNGVGVGGQVVEFRNSCVRALGHHFLLACSMQLGKQCDRNNLRRTQYSITRVAVPRSHVLKWLFPLRGPRRAIFARWGGNKATFSALNKGTFTLVLL
jgi:hypothetical protein